MGMTERTTEIKPVLSDATTVDTTVTDTVRINLDENHETPASDPEPVAFDPGKFSRIEFSPEERRKMRQVKLPRLAPEFFLDTQPPNKGLQAPPPPAEADPVPLVAKQRPKVAVVLVCLFGALFVLALALFRFLLNKPESTPMQTPSVASATEIPSVSAQIVASATSAPTMPLPPALTSPPALTNTPAQPAPPASELESPRQVTTSPHAKTSASSKPLHSALASPSSASTSTSASTSPNPPAPTAPMTAPSSTAPLQPTWFNYKQ